MKKIYFLSFFVLSLLTSTGQTSAITNDGKRVILYGNGSWRYTDSLVSAPSASLGALYSEAYDYAYELLYSEEFFSNERRNKSIHWAEQYVRDNLVINIGTRSLEQWFDELYSFAYDHIFKSDFFNIDKRTKAVEWAAAALKSKGYFEDYRISFIKRHKLAYDLAYNRIYRNEFMSKERRIKSLEWANDFIKKG